MSDLLQAFDIAPKEAWQRQIQKELSGNDLATLEWKHPELGNIPPYFNQDDRIPGLPLPPRSYTAQSGDWEAVQTFVLGSDTNAAVLQSLMHGTSGLKIVVKGSASPDELTQLFKGVYLNMVSLHLKGASDAQLVVLKQLSANEQALSGCSGVDAVRIAMEHNGNFNFAGALLQHVESVKALQPRMRSVHVDASVVFEAGGGEALELAYAVHNAHCCLNALLAGEISVDDAAAEFQFTLSAGQSYFVTLAKFRALRYLWARVVSEYAPVHDCSLVAWIHAETSQRQYGLRDVHSNLLRNTTAAMAAIAGGCDSLDVTDHIPWAINEDTRRWARNIQHLLRDESGFGWVVDQAAASSYIEFLTGRLIEKALEYINAWEERGGLTSAEGVKHFRNTLEEQRIALTQRWSDGQAKVVGSNVFQPKNEAYPNVEWPIDGQGIFERINCASILKNTQEA